MIVPIAASLYVLTLLTFARAFSLRNRRRYFPVCVLIAVLLALVANAPIAHAAYSWKRTQASYYTQRPSSCYDGGGRHVMPRNVSVWTAHKTYRCGSRVRVAGPHGRLWLQVWDRGPYVRGRDFDLNTRAFKSICGSLSRGVCRVSYRR